MGPYNSTAGHTDATGHGSMVADPNVVANLYQIVELYAVSDDGVLQGAAINTGVGANLYIVTDQNSTQLFNFLPGARIRGKAKSVSTDDDARMQQASVADNTVFTHCDTRPEFSVSTNPGTALYHAQSPNPCCRMNKRASVDHRTGVYLRSHWAHQTLLPELGDAGEIQIGLIGHDAGTARKCGGLQLWVHYHASRS
jgi:hypothetical protein